ncbi:uncharacterized protein LOC129004429 isoform X2 [Macrosteles quadrilineatus]|nr:uncharacterized protein LOC128987762 [Macrosteles quadrilineatus]XP_054288991.1 uncharacterized protein LOC129004429 isoform X2 [Macrosteles quadrilineatus]
MDEEKGSTSQSMSPDSVDEERPLKKARYVWQIKGRCRLDRPRGGRSCSHQSQAQPQQAAECPIGRWQTRQMARAVVDNTINSVLEDMGFTPPPDNEDIISFDIFPTIHNREGIENQAVLMAIQSHGLQKPCICSHSLGASVSTHPVPFHHRPSTPLPSTSEPQEKYAGETDFLAQAVAVAIQKKGLGSYSETDHG